MMEIPKRYLSIDELAVYIGLSRRSISRMISERCIPFNRVSAGRIRFDIRAIDRWMERKCIQAKPVAA